MYWRPSTYAPTYRSKTCESIFTTAGSFFTWAVSRNEVNETAATQTTAERKKDITKLLFIQPPLIAAWRSANTPRYLDFLGTRGRSLSCAQNWAHGSIRRSILWSLRGGTAQPSSPGLNFDATN